ncbi:MAG TPA: hypothetical protein VF897_01470 [Roseiflexaceae bacterium]
MSCDANFSRFARQAGQAPAIAAALGAGDAAHTAAAQEEIAELARTRAAQALRSREPQRTTAHQVADLQAMAHCSLLFERMQARDIKPPSHGRPKRGMPFAMPDDPAAMYAYAAVAETLVAIETGQPLPPLAREVLAGVRARAAAAAPARLPLAPGQRYTREHILDARDGDAVHVRLTRLIAERGRMGVCPRCGRYGDARKHACPQHLLAGRRAATTAIAAQSLAFIRIANGADADGNAVRLAAERVLAEAGEGARVQRVTDLAALAGRVCDLAGVQRCDRCRDVLEDQCETSCLNCSRAQAAADSMSGLDEEDW